MKISLIFLIFFMVSVFSEDVLRTCVRGDRGINCAGATPLVVCGWYNSEIDCDSYPCAARFSSICAACRLNYVEKVTMGRCPSPII